MSFLCDLDYLFSVHGRRIAVFILGMLTCALSIMLVFATVDAQEATVPWLPIYAVFGVWPWVVSSIAGAAVAVYGLMMTPGR
jgi:ABC-type Zn uptake system ZnuABC Zn-binding protein ZnuA